MTVPRWLRAVIPVMLILGWLAAASVGGPYLGRIDEVSSNDQTSFLPASAEAARVQNVLRDFRDGDTVPAVVVFQREGGLHPTDRLFGADVAASIAGFDGVAEGVSPSLESDDGEALEIIVPVTMEGSLETVKALRAFLAEQTPDGLEHYLTGPAGFTADLVAAFAGTDGVLLIVALSSVLLILLIVYRSPLLPILVLGTALIALSASILIVWRLAKSGLVSLDGQAQGILFILVIGAATDYSLLYVSRYREALRDHQKRWNATLAALRGSLEPILASGGTVIVALLCLLLSDLNSNKALGPVAAIGVALSVCAALTLLPALLLACGRASFWPLRPRFNPNPVTLRRHPMDRLWGRVGRLVSGHSRMLWVSSTVLLLIATGGVLQLKAAGVPQSDLILSSSQARSGQAVLGEHFPAGTGSPALILGDEDLIDELANASAEVRGIDSVVAVSNEEPKVVNGRILLQATLTDAADSAAAGRTIGDLREEVRGVDPDALVGGVTAIAIDTDRTSIEDRNRIIPLVLAVILLILTLLLRSIVAPVLLILSVIVSFGAALGVAALVFNGVFRFPGADPSVPLFGFVFLVALGIDYNIFLMTRVREESLLHGTREGIVRGLAVTGGVITSAGIVLAATFAALSVIPVLFLVQIAFIVAFGVLLDTLIVRSLLVPAAAYDIGRRIWWPSKLGRTDAGNGGPRGSRARRGEYR
ncbi:MAG: hypothetical protein JWL94_2038 [Microbacteriaceae bacterium]|nr:hypothetical protein [Microbacteriaceae bacterium]